MNSSPGATVYPSPRSSNGNVPSAPTHHPAAVHRGHFNYHHPPLSTYRYSPYSLPPIYIENRPEQAVPQLSHHVLDLHATNGAGPSNGGGIGGDLGAGSSGSSRSPSAGTLCSPVTDKEHSDAMVVLTEKELWRSFDLVGSEMIVTKSGRRLFPTILITVTGLIPSVKYTIKVRFVSADKYRHKYITGHWTAVGESDIIHDESKMVFKHPSSPCYGEMWLKKPISFKSIKITHHNESENGTILLHTMHKYRIEVVITPHEENMSEMVFPLVHSDFIAVTSYQSSAITKLKVDNNPFAKGFRDREVFTTQFASHSSCSPFLSPPYTPFLHRSFWTAPNGSVFPSMSNIPCMFPSSAGSTPSVSPQLTTSATTAVQQPLQSSVNALPSTQPNQPPMFQPLQSSTNNAISSPTVLQPTQAMFQSFFPQPSTSTTISSPLFPPINNIIQQQPTATACGSHMFHPLLAPPSAVYHHPPVTSLPMYPPMTTTTTAPLLYPPLTNSVPLSPLSPSPPSPAGSSCSSRTYSAHEEEGSDQEETENKD